VARADPGRLPKGGQFRAAAAYLLPSANRPRRYGPQPRLNPPFMPARSHSTPALGRQGHSIFPQTRVAKPCHRLARLGAAETPKPPPRGSVAGPWAAGSVALLAEILAKPLI
jgi:hypothetical protein